MSSTIIQIYKNNKKKVYSSSDRPNLRISVLKTKNDFYNV
jgi:hypothetical protein